MGVGVEWVEEDVVIKRMVRRVNLNVFGITVLWYCGVYLGVGMCLVGNIVS